MFNLALENPVAVKSLNLTLGNLFLLFEANLCYTFVSLCMVLMVHPCHSKSVFITLVPI